MYEADTVHKKMKAVNRFGKGSATGKMEADRKKNNKGVVPKRFCEVPWDLQCHNVICHKRGEPFRAICMVIFLQWPEPSDPVSNPVKKKKKKKKEVWRQVSNLVWDWTLKLIKPWIISQTNHPPPPVIYRTLSLHWARIYPSPWWKSVTI